MRRELFLHGFYLIPILEYKLIVDAYAPLAVQFFAGFGTSLSLGRVASIIFD